jgi:hypothetical protein
VCARTRTHERDVHDTRGFRIYDGCVLMNVHVVGVVMGWGGARTWVSSIIPATISSAIAAKLNLTDKTYAVSARNCSANASTISWCNRILINEVRSCTSELIAVCWASLFSISSSLPSSLSTPLMVAFRTGSNSRIFVACMYVSGCP